MARKTRKEHEREHGEGRVLNVTTKVRIAVAVVNNPDGTVDYIAHGEGLGADDDLAEDALQALDPEEGAAVHVVWVEADVPVPQFQEEHVVAGTVVDVEEIEDE